MEANIMDGIRPARTGDKLLTPGEVASLFRVKPRTVTTWNKMGKLGAVRTLGGHRRYSAAEVDALLRKRTGGGIMQRRAA